MPSINGKPLGLLQVPGGPTVRPMFRSLGISASGISAQRQRMETIAQNIANADVTRGEGGAPYKRRAVMMETATATNAPFPSANAEPGLPGAPFQVPVPVDGARTIEVPFLQTTGAAGVMGNTVLGGGEHGVRVAGIAEDQGEGRLVYEPGHPDANAEGYVRYPDIDTTQELVNLLDAKRIYEANATVFQTAKSMLRAALDI